MNHCSACGATTEQRVPEGDDRPRHVCTSCGTVHYLNPKLVVGCLVERPGEILLCRRAIEPQLGLWTPPAGYMELYESAAEGAVRETWEEAKARVEVTSPFAYLDITHIGQCYLMFRARMLEDSFAAGPESSDVRWFSIDNIPWEELAFPVLQHSMRLYVKDLADDAPRVHFGAVRWNREGSRYDGKNYSLEGHHALAIGKDHK